MTATTVRQMRALFRVEWILFNRIRSNYFFAVVIPGLILVGMQFVQDQMDLPSLGLAAGPVLVATSAGILLIFTLYSSVTGLYVARREELVLKRLRAGEVPDGVILAGGALMYVVLTIVQIVTVALVLSVMFDVVPGQPASFVLALVTGTALMTAMAAATAALCRTAEAVLVATLPAVLVLPMLAGIYVPHEVLPDSWRPALELSPLAGTIDLVRSGWTGELGAAQVMTKVVVDLVWTGLFAWVAVRRFRWEPRT